MAVESDFEPGTVLPLTTDAALHGLVEARVDRNLHHFLSTDSKARRRVLKAVAAMRRGGTPADEDAESLSTPRVPKPTRPTRPGRSNSGASGFSMSHRGLSAHEPAAVQHPTAGASPTGNRDGEAETGARPLVDADLIVRAKPEIDHQVRVHFGSIRDPVFHGVEAEVVGPESQRDEDLCEQSNGDEQSQVLGTLSSDLQASHQGLGQHHVESAGSSRGDFTIEEEAHDRSSFLPGAPSSLPEDGPTVTEQAAQVGVLPAPQTPLGPQRPASHASLATTATTRKAKKKKTAEQRLDIIFDEFHDERERKRQDRASKMKEIEEAIDTGPILPPDNVPIMWKPPAAVCVATDVPLELVERDLAAHPNLALDSEHERQPKDGKTSLVPADGPSAQKSPPGAELPVPQPGDSDQPHELLLSIQQDMESIASIHTGAGGSHSQVPQPAVIWHPHRFSTSLAPKGPQGDEKVPYACHWFIPSRYWQTGDRCKVPASIAQEADEAQGTAAHNFWEQEQYELDQRQARMEKLLPRLFIGREFKRWLLGKRDSKRLRSQREGIATLERLPHWCHDIELNADPPSTGKAKGVYHSPVENRIPSPIRTRGHETTHGLSESNFRPEKRALPTHSRVTSGSQAVSSKPREKNQQEQDLGLRRLQPSAPAATVKTRKGHAIRRVAAGGKEMPGEVEVRVAEGTGDVELEPSGG